MRLTEANFEAFEFPEVNRMNRGVFVIGFRFGSALPSEAVRSQSGNEHLAERMNAENVRPGASDTKPRNNPMKDAFLQCPETPGMLTNVDILDAFTRSPKPPPTRLIRPVQRSWNPNPGREPSPASGGCGCFSKLIRWWRRFQRRRCRL